MADTSREPWHLDKRVPIATLAVLVTQIVIGVMWITTISNTVAAHGAEIVTIRSDASAREARIRAAELAIAGQASDLRAIQASLGRIERLLEARP